MDNLLTIVLEAHHRQRNHHRSYRITVGRDLLGDRCVSIRYGRTGQYGQERRFGVADAGAMQAVVRDYRAASCPRPGGSAAPTAPR